MSAWMTNRTSGLSIPMPKAFVATMTRSAPPMNLSWTSLLVSGGIPAWKCSAAVSFARKNSEISSVRRRVAQ